jgi:phage terminase large subunit-like protein
LPPRLEADGLPLVDFPQNPARMCPATQRTYELVANRGLTHDGDARLARHVGNAVLKPEFRGARIVKDYRKSPRKIDLAVATIMAVDRAAVAEPAYDLWAPAGSGAKASVW